MFGRTEGIGINMLCIHTHVYMETCTHDEHEKGRVLQSTKCRLEVNNCLEIIFI